jgi:hypothetical protein
MVDFMTSLLNESLDGTIEMFQGGPLGPVDHLRIFLSGGTYERGAQRLVRTHIDSE